MTTVNLEKLSCLAELFNRLGKNGEHINRASQPMLWANLEQERASYEMLFTSLGYELRIDNRGFAWFHTAESSTTSNQNTRRLALFFMVIFKFQSDAGKPLRRFTDWRIDNDFLVEVYGQSKEVLSVEGITIDEFPDIAKTAERFGFMSKDSGAYYLLPSVHRYLDHFEALAATIDDDFGLDDEKSVMDGEQEESHER